MNVFPAPLSIEERAMHPGATHRAVIKAADLTEATANTSQALTGPTVPANTGVAVVKVILKTAFEDASDENFNTTPLTIGDVGDTDRLLTSVELNDNGTEVIVAFPTSPAAATYAAPSATPSAATGGDAPTETEYNNLRTTVDSVRTQLVALAADVAAIRARQTIMGYVYSSATELLFTFGSMSGKALNDLDVGEVHIFLNITDGITSV